MKKTDAELIWDALLNNAEHTIHEQKSGVNNRVNLDTLERQRELNDLELSDQEKAVLDQMISYMSSQLPADEPYKKANKISAMWNYIKRRMQRG